MSPRFSLSLLSLTTLLACADSTSPATRYADRGPHGVGYTVLQHEADEASLEVRAWYPSAEAEEAIEYEVALKLGGFDGAVVPFLGAAARDGAPDTELGARPLVVLSHGYSLNPEWYLDLAEHLASHGFVVLAPEHAESDWASDIVQSTLARPQDVSATLDLAESAPLGGLIDTEAVAVLGHSYGGYTALAAAGARFDLDALAERCADVDEAFTEAYFCTPFLEGEAALAEGMGLSAPPEGLWPSLGDPRVQAIVSMAGDAYLFGEAGLAEVRVPALLIGGTADTGTPWGWGAGLSYEALGSAERTLVAFEGGEHMLPVTACENMPWVASLPPEYRGYFCEDPAWDKAEAHAQIQQLTTAFLLHTLAGAPEAAEAMHPALYAEVPGMQVQRAE